MTRRYRMAHRLGTPARSARARKLAARAARGPRVQVQRTPPLISRGTLDRIFAVHGRRTP